MASSPRLCWGLFFAALVLSPPILGEQTPDLRAHFESETNPVRKAKLMQKLGSDEFRDIEKAVSDRQYEQAARLLDQYHAEVEQSSKELDQSDINAEKKPDGFKQLQFSVREALERLDRLISTMTADEQVRFRHDRDDLEELNSHLLQELFPSQKPRHTYHHIPIP